jgi:hypothetical protein
MHIPKKKFYLLFLYKHAKYIYLLKIAINRYTFIMSFNYVNIKIFLENFFKKYFF